MLNVGILSKWMATTMATCHRIMTFSFLGCRKKITVMQACQVLLHGMYPTRIPLTKRYHYLHCQPKLSWRFCLLGWRAGDRVWKMESPAESWRLDIYESLTSKNQILYTPLRLPSLHRYSYWLASTPLSPTVVCLTNATSPAPSIMHLNAPL